MPRRDPNNLIKMPELPKLPQVTRKASQAAPYAKAIPQPVSDKELLIAKWKVWQQRSDVKGNGTASILEYQCWAFLVDVKRQRPEIDFFYQAPIAGGRTAFGGFVADFYFPVQKMVWNPAGLHFHWTTTRNRTNDALSKMVLANKGIKEIFIYEDDLENRPLYVLELAWQGIQVAGRDKD